MSICHNALQFPSCDFPNYLDNYVALDCNVYFYIAVCTIGLLFNRLLTLISLFIITYHRFPC
jgi:hypothetical protein